MKGTDFYITPQVETCPSTPTTHWHSGVGGPGERSPFQPLPLEKAIKIHAVQILTEGLSTQVLVDRPGSEGTEKHFITLASEQTGRAVRVQQVSAGLVHFQHKHTGPEASSF